MVTIDHSLCRRDGMCKNVCPMGLFEVDNEGFPLFRPGAAETCIACGHCMAVCHQDALQHGKLPKTDAPVIDTALMPSPEATAQLLRIRRSIREFRPEPVPEKMIRGAIEAARWAPTAVNCQPVHWLGITDPAEVKALAGQVVEFLKQSSGLPSRYAAFVKEWEKGNDLILRNAPHLIVLYAADDWAWSTVDCTITLTQFELAAVAQGFGTCWAGFLMWAAREHAPIREALGIPKGHGVYGAMMMGLPRHRYYRSPPREAAKVEWR